MLPMIATVGVKSFWGYEQLFDKIPQEQFSLMGESDRSVTGYIFRIHCLYYVLRTPFLIPAACLWPKMPLRLRVRCRLLLVSLFSLFRSMRTQCLYCLSYVVRYRMPQTPFLFGKYDFPVGFKGLVVAGMLAVIMSTPNSDLNIASISVVQDLVKLLLGKRKLEVKTEWLVARIAFIVGVGTVFLV